MRYLTADEILWIHEQEVGRGLRDRHLLEAAAGRPRSSAGGEDAFPDVHAKAAALFHSLAATQPFLDGNKRTAALAMIAFYNLNGYRVAVPEEVDLVHLAVDVAIHEIDEVDEVAQRLKGWAVLIDESELPDSEPPSNLGIADTTEHLDPAFLPFVPVIGLAVAADEDDLHKARSVLHEDLVADVEANTTGWAKWWADNRQQLTGYGDDDKWAMTISELAWHHQWEQWGRRVSITARESMPTEPGGVTEHGELYEQVAGDAVAERTFWVVETDEGWKVRGFNIT